jgi:hypothetical protein
MRRSGAGITKLSTVISTENIHECRAMRASSSCCGHPLFATVLTVSGLVDLFAHASKKEAKFFLDWHYEKICPYFLTYSHSMTHHPPAKRSFFPSPPPPPWPIGS